MSLDEQVSMKDIPLRAGWDRGCCELREYLVAKPRSRLPRYGIMYDEYRLAWANIEGWTTNAKSPQFKCGLFGKARPLASRSYCSHRARRLRSARLAQDKGRRERSLNSKQFATREGAGRALMPKLSHLDVGHSHIYAGPSHAVVRTSKEISKTLAVTVL
jgi:hypothetical protein